MNKDKEKFIEQKESPILVLPLDSEKRSQLMRKLDEYKTRHQKERYEDPYKPPEHFETHFRIDILERLFSPDGNQRIIAWEYAAEIANDPGMSAVHLDMALNSLGVIYDYIETGGLSNKGGTGLK